MEQIKKIAITIEDTDLKQRKIRQKKDEENLERRLLNQKIMEERC